MSPDGVLPFTLTPPTTTRDWPPDEPYWMECGQCDGTGILSHHGEDIRCDLCEGDRGWYETGEPPIPLHLEDTSTLRGIETRPLRPEETHCADCGSPFDQEQHVHDLTWLRITVCCRCCQQRQLPCTILQRERSDKEFERDAIADGAVVYR